jgi:hypothetical protein
VTVNVYRTIGTSPGVFYLASSSVVPAASPATNQPVINSHIVDTVTFVDELSDAAIIGNPRLYTTGNVLEASAPPPVNELVVFQNRLFGIDTTDPLALAYTQQVTPGTPIVFSDYLRMNLDPKIGRATALAVMDEKLVIFGPTSCWYVVGAGPDATGASSSYQDPQLIPGNVGCENPKSIVLTDQGLVFQSRRGLYLLPRGLAGAVYIGAEVEDLVDGATVTSALAIPSATQVRFTLDSGVAVVFDTLVGQWSVYTAFEAVDAVIWQGEFTRAKASGLVLAEVADTYADAAQSIAVQLRTGPIRLAGLAGFQRVRELVILGSYESAHALEVSVMYDGNPSSVQTTTVTPSSPSTWGGDPTWGDSSVWGGTFQPYIWRVFLNRQKCESVQISIREVPDGTPGAGLALSGLTFEIAAKRGAWKAPASSTFGG